jgi:tRNA-splicing ligase RtcB (3'-phosphate/5'-hydroxy nucleic acid ligase)
MIRLQDIKKINEFEWEIPSSFRRDMRGSVRIFNTREMLPKGLEDRSFEQAVNASTLPGLVGEVAVMPDVHQGYGFPIGGVAATQLPDGVISPGAIGYDINCGVRLMTSSIEYQSAQLLLEVLTNRLYVECPSGVGSESTLKLTQTNLKEICREGSSWALKKGYASQEDLELTEDQGCLDGADPKDISPRALERGIPQVGSLGSGNHFIEIDRVERIYDEKAAQVMGIQENCLCLMLHSGSRGLGHQVCTDYVHDYQRVSQRFGIQLPDRELVCAPLSSPDGQAYLSAMRCAANYAFCNRQVLAYFARQVFESVFAGKLKNFYLHLVYDLAHNMGKIETHQVDGRPVKVLVHRKGATRSFGPGMPGVPARYQAIGQPVLVPGSMGTTSWVLAGTQTSMQKSFGSACHGAGRVFSRSQARHQIHGEELRKQLLDEGIYVKAGSLSGLAEEAPQAYKDVDQVVECVVGAGLAKKVACLKPLAVIKG